METEDIKDSWLNPVRHAQAACHKNRGYAILNMTVVVRENEPILWLDPELTKISPIKLSKANMTPTVIALLAQMAKHNDEQFDIEADEK